jgi:hypothetical protein
MKRNDLLAATLVLAASLALGPALRGADPVPQCPNCPNCPAKAADKAKAVKETKEKLVHELVTILNETKSADTFVVTASCLGMMGHDARPAVPSIIRNAERLGLLKGASEVVCDEESEESKPTKQQRMAEGIMDCLDQILSKQPSGPKPPQSYQPCATLPVPVVCPAPGMAMPENIGFPVLPPPPPPAMTVPQPARPVYAAPPQSDPPPPPPARNPPPATCPFSFILGFTR